MNSAKHILLVSILIFIQIVCRSSDLTTQSGKAKKMFEESIELINTRNYASALNKVQKAIEYDSKFIEAWLLLAEISIDLNNSEKAIEAYQKAIEINPSFYPQALYFKAQLLFHSGRYQEALVDIDRYLSSNKQELLRENAQFIKKCSEFSINSIQKPVPFHPIELGKGINTNYNEYWPSVSADNQSIVFTRLIPKNPNIALSINNSQEDIFESHQVDSIWSKAKELGSPINTFDNEGNQSLSADGNFMFFTACNRPTGSGGCDLYFSKKEGDQWSAPYSLGPTVNTKYKEAHPSISPDGRTLYFSSNRPEGKGGMDLWVTRLDDQGKWSTPLNLGDSINTKGNEEAPFIHHDNQTLYFSSNGHIGMGGTDLYLSRIYPNGNWSKPLNLGYPINTYLDETGLVVEPGGAYAYYSSDRVKERGMDLYRFELPLIARPVETTYMRGNVFDSETKQPLSARFELIDLHTKLVISRALSSSSNGQFLISIPTDKQYALNVSKKKYLFFSKHFEIKGVHEKTEPYLVDIALQPIRQGSKAVLNNIFFETAKAELKIESEAELDRLVKFLNDNPSVTIEIGGHTDNVGSDTDNLTLSSQRAFSVVSYLTSKGITENRLKPEGYGETQPIGDNNTTEGRALNRRTEVKILSN